jgi:hypothetical protein
MRGSIERDARLSARIVEEAKFDTGGVRGEDRHRGASVARVKSKTERIKCGGHRAGGGDW